MTEKSLIENFKNLLYTKLWSEFILSRVTGDECEMARCLLEPRVYFWEPAVLIFSKVSRTGVNIQHLVEAKAKLNSTYLTRRALLATVFYWSKTYQQAFSNKSWLCSWKCKLRVKFFGKIVKKLFEVPFFQCCLQPWRNRGNMTDKGGRLIFGEEGKKWGDIQQKWRFLKCRAKGGPPPVPFPLEGNSALTRGYRVHVYMLYIYIYIHIRIYILCVYIYYYIYILI